MDRPFGRVINALTSQNLSYLSSCGCIRSKDLCCQTVKTSSLLRRNTRNHTCNTVFCYFLPCLKFMCFLMEELQFYLLGMCQLLDI